MTPVANNTAKLSHLLGRHFVPGTTDVSVHGLSLRASDVSPGGLFLACAGAQHHGLDFLDQAIAAGAVAVVWEPKAGVDGTDADIVNIPVAGLSAQVSDIADRFFDSPSKQIQIVGVTGTNGKTSTVKLIADALEQLGFPCGVIGTLGAGRPGELITGGLTTPDAVSIQSTLSEFRDNRVAYAAMEVSSHGLEQHRVKGVRFRTAVFTNLTRDHLDYHGDMNSYARAKSQLFSWPNLEAAIINLSDEYGQQIWNEIPENVKPIGLWLGDSDCHVAQDFICATEIIAGDHGIEISFLSSWGNGKIVSKLLGHFNGLNILSAAAVLLQWGFSLKQTIAALSLSKPVPGRMEFFGGNCYPLVVVDYSHTPDALEKALLAVREHCRGLLCVVFGCGGERDPGKRPLMGGVAAELADQLIVTDDNPRNENPEQITNDILAGIPEGVACSVQHDRGQAIADAINRAGPGDAVLIAGKGHEDYQIRGGQYLDFDDREHARRVLGSTR